MSFLRRSKEQGVRFKGRYMGGHPAYPKTKGCQLFLRSDGLEIPEMELKIPYHNIEEVANYGRGRGVSEAATGFFLGGVMGGLLSAGGQDVYLLLLIDDDYGRYYMAFDVKGLEKFQPLILQRVMAARKGSAEPP